MLDIHINFNSKNEKLLKQLDAIGFKNKFYKKNKSKEDLSLNIFIKRNRKEIVS
jgi:uncharacterized protein (DUF1919 family)